ncbi:phytoene desaturase family protein [Euzebya tangerina]|uniref:phytoene desaturase family protein n=1 Tax=Euzebya tangerina TaxID=591198 RepID=UPI000E322A04|nr:NAD(P)/FAD-dependent oxidoreductase [Euzebya tangerina]
MRDVVVIGAGHNALVAACYLARAGLDVEIVERRDVVGGAVSTVERFDGYKMDVGSSAHIMVRHTGIVEELALGECGLTYIDMDPWGFAPVSADPTAVEAEATDAIAFHIDLDTTCESIARVCGAAEADAYQAFATDWGGRNQRIFELFQEAPTMVNMGRRMAGLGRRAGLSSLELSRQFLTSADALLDEHFTDERLKSALAWLGAQSGPPTHEPATADLVGWNMVMHHLAPGRAVGGSGSLSVALAERFRRYGGTIRLGDGAAGITTAAGRTSGVLTESGDHIAAQTVVAGCHVLTTLSLVAEHDLPSGFAERARRTIRTGNGIGMVVRLGTSTLPEYPGSLGGAEHHAMQLLAPSRRFLREAHGEFVAGRPPSKPAALAMAFSAIDPSIAPAGKHNITVWGQWHPFELSNGEEWDTIKEREGQKLIAAVDARAPGFADSVEHAYVQTPLDLQRELGLVRGQVMHVDMSLDQMFSWRPMPELSGYRMPLDGLYLTGASTHPGGGVFGASGRTAARIVLDDAKPSVMARVSRDVKARLSR